jgi:HSP20 family protein
MTFLSRRDFATFQERMNRIARETFSPERSAEALTTSNCAPPVGVYEDEHDITLKIEVPGIDENTVETGQVSAHYEKGVLKILLAKKAEAKPKLIKVIVEKTLEAKSARKVAG